MDYPKEIYIEIGNERLEDSTLYENKDAIQNVMIQNRISNVTIGVYKLVDRLDFELGYKVTEVKK
jgi:hypothetical protein